MNRTQVLWIGRPPSDEHKHEARRRELIISLVQRPADADTAFARGLIADLTAGHYDSGMSNLEPLLRPAIDDGLMVVVVIEESQAHLEEATELLNRLPQCVRHLAAIKSRPDSHVALHLVHSHRAAETRNSQLTVRAHDCVLDEQDERLLQRAFPDCREVVLRPLSPGKSGARAYIAEAKLLSSNAGPMPAPYVVKVHVPEKIAAEMATYERYAEHHIPWLYRPNVDRRRSVLGYDRALLVSALVGNSVSLTEALSEHPESASRILRNLFSDSLAGLREQEMIARPDQGRVIDPLSKHFKADAFPHSTYERAKSHFGAKRNAKQLKAALLNLPPRPWRCGVIHGDLHSDNLRVLKGHLVVVIDFAHSNVGPLCSDVAQLYVSLGMHQSEIQDSDGTWCAETQSLFEPQLLLSGDSVSLRSTVEGWRWAALAELRVIARESAECPGEFAQVLALHLLRFAQYEPDAVGAEASRRALAYALAETIIERLEDRARTAIREAA